MALELSYQSTGQGDPLLVLHGLFGSGGNWRGVARALADRHRVLLVDLRNHGGSPWADSMGYVEMADDVLDLVRRERLGRVSLMGHSMGGKVAMTLALRAPQCVERLVVVDVAPVAYADRLSLFAEAMRAVDTLQAASREEVRQRLAERVDDAGIVAFLMQNLVTRNAHFDWRLNLAAILAAIPQLGGFPDTLRSLRYHRPVRVIAGERSDYVQRRDGADFRPMFPEATVDVISGAGHWVHADRPDAFVDAARHALAAQTAARQP